MHTDPQGPRWFLWSGDGLLMTRPNPPSGEYPLRRYTRRNGTRPFALNEVVVWLVVVSSGDGLYAVALWWGCRSASTSAWGPFWPLVTRPRLRGSPPGGRGVGGEEEGGGETSGPGEARTILLFHIISARPSKQPLIVRIFLKVYMDLGSYFGQKKDIIIT